MSNTMRVYFCGGAAINIASAMVARSGYGHPSDARARLEVALIDTSRANITKIAVNHDLIKDCFYQIEGVNGEEIDGSGMERKTNLKAAQIAVPDILNQYPARDINIVVHSGSGGSGSVAGPTLVSELLKRGENVVVLMIGSSGCLKESKNTRDTIMTYQSISQLRQRPVVCCYFDNATHSMKVNNDSATMLIDLLAAVWSGNNHGLDRKDLENFLNYQVVTQFPVGLVGLGVVSGSDTPRVEKGIKISTLLSLVDENNDPTLDIAVPYRTFGICENNLLLALPMHIYTLQGFFNPVINDLEKKIEEGEELYRINPVQSLKVSGNVEEDGLVIS